MKKALFTLAAILAFGIAQAQTDTTSTKSTKTEKSTTKSTKTKAQTNKSATKQDNTTVAPQDQTMPEKKKRNSNPATSPTAPGTPGTGTSTSPTTKQ